MGSRKEEERNEKVIRGLMKLPPNRRCINCNSLGPQYVCTNFWTFVCMTCSGIHREFTHRVKSVSMAKFTTQEVEALQNGGNQRAREIYLKDWDIERQRLPNSSNAVKVREFIKDVYEDRTYAGGKTCGKPPRDMQSHKSFNDETRRASSYHSYSQSPPYDYQYEERRYGKQAGALTRKPGLDRGHSVGKISSFVYSPGHVSDQMFEDRFANEGSGSRASDYSVSSGGEPVRSGMESPNFYKENGFNSPPLQFSKDISSENVHKPTINLFSEPAFKMETDGIPRPQKPRSFGSSGSFDNNSISIKSFNSGNLADAVSAAEQPAGIHQDKVSTITQSSTPVNYGGLDLFNIPVAQESDSSRVSLVNLFQLPEASLAPSVDASQPSTLSPAQAMNSYPPPLSDLFAKVTGTLPAAKPLELSVQKNEGWATFDTQPPQGTESVSDSILSTDGDSSLKFDQLSDLKPSMQWPPLSSSSADNPTSLICSPWLENLPTFQAPAVTTSTQSWNAFDDSLEVLPFEGFKPTGQPPLVGQNPSPITGQPVGLRFLEDSSFDGSQSAANLDGPLDSDIPVNNAMPPTYTPPIFPLTGVETQPHEDGRKSANPFDIPYDSDMEQNSMFLDMSSLQVGLPTDQLPPAFLDGISEPWFPQNLIPAVPQVGSLAYMAELAPTAQLQNVTTQGHVASVGGGNPFA